MPRLLPAVLIALTAGGVLAQEPAPPEGVPLDVATVVIAGVEEIDPPVRLPRRLPIEPGTPYTAERLAATESLLLEALAEAGRPYALVEASAGIDHAAGTADVLLSVEPGPLVRFGEIGVRVPSPLREKDVRARIAYEPGDLFRPSAVDRTRAALEAMPGVGAAGIQAIGLEVGDTVIATVVGVTRPDALHGIQLGGTLSSIQCLELSAFWRHQHFLGAPRIFTIGGGFANLLADLLDSGFPCLGAGDSPYSQANYFITADLLQPLVPDPPTQLQLRGFFRRQSAAQAYLVHGFGAHASVARQIRPGTVATLSYSPERNELRAAGHYFCINFGACGAAAIEELAEARWLAPLEASLRWMPAGLRDPLTGPGAREEGLWPGVIGPLWLPWARIGIAAAGGPTGSRFGYLRGIGEAAITRLTSPRTEVAARVRVGGLALRDDVLPPQVRFYSGGANTVRGVPQNLLGPLVLVTRPADAAALGCEPEPGGCPPQLRPHPDRVSVRPRGGTAVAEANVEGRLWLARRFQLVAFIDGGVVRGDDGLGDLAERTWQGMVAPGLGIRWLTGLGPLRIDVGYDPRSPREVPILLEDPAAPEIVPLGRVIWDRHTFDDPGGGRELWRRLQIHIAVGQPF